MYDLLFNIAERCHTAATKRGKDTTGVGCIKSLRIELGEYWKAADRSAETPEFDEIIEKTGKLSDEDFASYYEANLHNTAADELADILIVAATWLWEAGAVYRCNAVIRGCAVCLRTHGRPARHRASAQNG